MRQNKINEVHTLGPFEISGSFFLLNVNTYIISNRFDPDNCASQTTLAWPQPSISKIRSTNHK
mgnify:CR=1 FL=1